MRQDALQYAVGGQDPVDAVRGPASTRTNVQALAKPHLHSFYSTPQLSIMVIMDSWGEVLRKLHIRTYSCFSGKLMIAAAAVSPFQFF